MDLIDVAINTYRLLVLGEDIDSIVENRLHVAFFLDPYDHYDMSTEGRIIAAQLALQVLEEEEHYEKCSDLRDYINDLRYDNV